MRDDVDDARRVRRPELTVQALAEYWRRERRNLIEVGVSLERVVVSLREADSEQAMPSSSKSVKEPKVCVGRTKCRMARAGPDQALPK